MSMELIYTSVPKGLRPNSSGFCTVAATSGMSRQVMMKLEPLGRYEFVYKISDPKASLNPVNFAHGHVAVGAETHSVLSRVAFSGADYSNRANKIAHHFMLSANDRLPDGPASMMLQMAAGGVFRTDWAGGPKQLPASSLSAALGTSSSPTVLPANTWQKVTGDAGWAGALAKAFRSNSKTPAYVVFAPGVDLLPLLAESLALLTPQERWSVCFATYYTGAAPGCDCHWRGVVAGSEAAKEIRRRPDATVIDLTQPLGPAGDDEFARAARQGKVVPLPSMAAPAFADRKAGKRKRKTPAIAATVEEMPILADEGPGVREAVLAELAESEAVGSRPQMPATPAAARRPRRPLALILLASAAVLLLAMNLVVTIAHITGFPPLPFTAHGHPTTAPAGTQPATSPGETDEFKKPYGQLEQKVNKLVGDFAKMNKANTGLKKKNDELKDKNTDLEKKVNDLTADNKRLGDRINELTKRLKKVEAWKGASPSKKTGNGEKDKPKPIPIENKLIKGDDPRVAKARKSEFVSGKKKGDSYVCEIGQPVGFLMPPGKLLAGAAPKVRPPQVKENGWQLEFCGSDPLRDLQPYLICKLASAGRQHTLELRPDTGQAKRKWGAVKSLTVEVLCKNGDAYVVYRCCISRKQEIRLSIGLDKDGRKPPLKAKAEPISYAWPEMLQIEGLKSAAGRSLPLGKSLSLGDDKKPLLKKFHILFEQKRDKGQEGVTVKFLSTYIEGLFGPKRYGKKLRKCVAEHRDYAIWERLLKDYNSVKKSNKKEDKKKLMSITKNIATKHGGVKDLERKIKLAKELHGIQDAFGKCPPITLRDPWGRIVAEIKLKFTLPP